MRAPALLLLAVTLMACGQSGDDPSGAAKPPASTSSPTAPAASNGDAQRTFLTLTAAHLCTVQASVYADASDIAAAYTEAPDYPGLTDDQVDRFSGLVNSDPDFSAVLLDEIAATCG